MTKASELHELLRTSPCKHGLSTKTWPQFRLPMTASTGLNPNLGIKTLPINGADTKLYAQFKHELKELMDEVKDEMKKAPAAKNKQKPAEQAQGSGH